jgi:hypothetical protein
MINVLSEHFGGSALSRTMVESVVRYFVPPLNKIVKIGTTKLFAKIVLFAHQSHCYIVSSPPTRALDYRRTVDQRAARKIVKTESNDRPKISEGHQTPMKRAPDVAAYCSDP